MPSKDDETEYHLMAGGGKSAKKEKGRGKESENFVLPGI